MLPTMSALRFGGAASASRRAAQRILPASLTVMPAAASASSALAAVAASVAPMAPSRNLHFPRTVRGVGPAPRVASFWKQPWLRRRLAAARARVWAQTHPIAPLDGSKPVVSSRDTFKQLPVMTLESTAQQGTVELNPAVFGVPLRTDIVWEVVRWQRASRRSGNHKDKDRSEVYGSGKKVRPQKGSGRARIGDPHAPHHRGGGHAFPRRPSDYTFPLPKQTIAMGKRVALTAKAAEGNLIIIDQSALSSHTEETFAAAMHAHKWGSFLMVHLEGELDSNLALSARRNPNYQFLTDREFNVYDCVRSQRLILTKGALESLHWRLAKENMQGLSAEKRLRFMVGSFGGGYTREEIDFVPTGSEVPQGAKLVEDVDVDGMQLVIKSGKPFVTPIHWP